MDAKLVVHEKMVYADGSIVEIKAWEVPKTQTRPEGYKYSMVYIDLHGQRALGYDNSKQQGHHKHVYEKQLPVEFRSIDELLHVFLEEVEALRGESL